MFVVGSRSSSIGVVLCSTFVVRSSAGVVLYSTFRVGYWGSTL